MYYHFRSQEFDCYNAAEYHTQMERYYRFKTRVVAVVPRSIRGQLYALVCLQHEETEKNSLCELAFQCMRQFAGISILVKRPPGVPSAGGERGTRAAACDSPRPRRACFVCHRPNSALCQHCHSAAYCSPECARQDWGRHNVLCQLARRHDIIVEDEVVEIF